LNSTLYVLAVATVFAAGPIVTGCSGRPIVLGTRTDGGGGQGPGSGGEPGRGGTGGGAVGTAGQSGGGEGGDTGGAGTGVTSTGVAGTGVAGTGVAGTTGAGGRPAELSANGSPCSQGSECISNRCTDGVCCASDCAGACVTCAGSTPGVCVLAANGTNPRGICRTDPPASCGQSGTCNGAGECRSYGATQDCDTTPSCDATNSSIVPKRVCNGAGSCVASQVQSCNGYRCMQSSGTPTCLTNCTADAGCDAGNFCTAGTCQTIANLAGNGDVEYGTLQGWSNFAGTALALSDTTAGGPSHAGRYATSAITRGIYYQGPGYNLPTGPGKYTITAWGMQKDLPAILTGVLQVRVACLASTYYLTVQMGGGFGMPMSQNTWVQFSGTIDTTTMGGTDCLPTASPSGLVKSATVWLNQVDQCGAGGLGPCPDLFIDDLVVRVTDGHNLVGNPNFEANALDGWTVSTGSAVVSISQTVAHGGTRSMQVAQRSLAATGPRYMLPIGAARYNFSFWVQHTGTQARDLALQTTYTCVSPPGAILPPAIATATQVPGQTWVQLTGTATLPPADAPAGCKLASAAVYVHQTASGACTAGECPDLYIDDVSITLAP
jgi:carbohydrate binding protein with CBM4/9 domain